MLTSCLEAVEVERVVVAARVAVLRHRRRLGHALLVRATTLSPPVGHLGACGTVSTASRGCRKQS